MLNKMTECIFNALAFLFLLTKKLYIIYVLFGLFEFTPTEPTTEVGMSHFSVLIKRWLL